MRTLAFLILLSAAVLRGEAVPPVDDDWRARPISTGFSEFESTTIYPCPPDRSIWATYCEKEKDWWGHMRVFKQSGDRIEWAATFPDQYAKERGCYVVSARWTSFPMLRNPVLELIESTHMGNGSLWLLELDGKELRLILQTRVMGRCWSDEAEFGIPPHGEARFEDAQLTVDYLRTDGNTETIKLSGTLAITDMGGKAVSSCGYLQLCVWNPDKRIFEVLPPRKADR